MPDVGLAWQPLLPPAQFWKPVRMSFTPMSMTVGPVTSGGKIFLSSRGEVKDMAISRSAQQAPVPRMAPYPLGQGRGVPEASEGHMPLAYI